MSVSVHCDVGRLLNEDPSPKNLLAVIIPLLDCIVIPVPICTSLNVLTPLTTKLETVNCPDEITSPLISKTLVGTVDPIPTLWPATTRTLSSTLTPSRKLKVFLIFAIYTISFLLIYVTPVSTVEPAS